jgi:hypothetical protein
VGFVQKFGNFVGSWMVNNSPIPLQVNLQAICAYGTDDDPASYTSVSSAQAKFERMERRMPGASQLKAVARTASTCTYGKINGKVKCLHTGEFCTMREPGRSQYRRYGFTCVGGRLRYS